MTTKTIANTTINGGYVLSGTYSALTITGTGTIQNVTGDVLSVPFAARTFNAGRLAGGVGPDEENVNGGSAAVLAGGVFDNSGTATGGDGTVGGYYISQGQYGEGGASGGSATSMTAAGTVINRGVLIGGVGGQGGPGASRYVSYENGYGGVTYVGGAGAGGPGGNGVALAEGGRVTNTGQIRGGYGGAPGAEESPGVMPGSYGAQGWGVCLPDGGTVVNGGDAAPAALISGGIFNNNAEGEVTVVNLGTIVGAAPGEGSYDVAVFSRAGGRVTNGSATESSAFIDGQIYLGGEQRVVNFGTITGEIQCFDPDETFFAESGSTAGLLNGFGAGDTLMLVGGAETITGLGGPRDDYTTPPATVTSITGAVTMQSLGVSFYEVGAAASLTVIGANTLLSGDRIVDEGGFGLATGAALTVDSGAMVEAVGAVANAGTLALDGGGPAAEFYLRGAGATLTGGGSISMSGAGARIVGAAAGTVLTNVDNTIAGSGDIGMGRMSLVNHGVIDGDGASLLKIDTGAKRLFNTGLIENSGPGGTLIVGAVRNAGTLAEVGAGTLTLEGVMSGLGRATIDGGTLYVEQAFGEKVVFTGPTGTLKLGDSQGFTGTVAGLSAAGTDALDLADIDFASGVTSVSFSGTASGGVLAVTDGTHTADITLIGDYIGSTFTLSGDGHGGTKVADPGSAAPSAAALAQAMAAVPTGSASPVVAAATVRPTGPPSLAAPI